MGKKHRGRPVSGIILLDKPAGESSNASLQKVRRLLDAAKAGHTGALDPLATGVLPLCFGEATKISQFLLDSDKAYRTRIRLGVKTDSGDAAGQVLAEQDVAISRNDLESVLENFRGEISQVPSMYSALKKDGVPLYKLARKGQVVEREPRKVSVHSLSLQRFDGKDVVLEIHCSKGTYIRSIADDLGDLLGCGAHVVELRRIKAGPFKLDACHTHEQLLAIREKGGLEALDALLIAPDLAITGLPAVQLPAATASHVRQGQAVIVSHLPPEGLVRLYDEGQFLGIGTILEDGRVAPKRLMAT